MVLTFISWSILKVRILNNWELCKCVVSDIQHDSKPCFKRQRSLKDYPFKKRRLYEQLDDFSNSVVIDDEDRPNTPQKAIESGSHLSLKSEGGLFCSSCYKFII